MTLEELAQNITDYITRAEALESVRTDLVKKLTVVMKKKIIPEINQLLPEHYSVNVRKSEAVIGYNGTGTPVRPYVHLRLMYNKRLTNIGSDKDEQIYDVIQQQLDPKLKEIAKRYNLDSINVGGEPASFG